MREQRWEVMGGEEEEEGGLLLSHRWSGSFWCSNMSDVTRTNSELMSTLEDDWTLFYRNGQCFCVKSLNV